MCGRYTLRRRGAAKPFGVPASQLPWMELLLTEFLTTERLPLAPRYNIAPSQTVPVIIEAGYGKGGGTQVNNLGYSGAREVALFQWGLVPSWSTESSGLINARAETLEETPSFAESFLRRRCLIPADGFYEWVRPASRLNDCLAWHIGPDLLSHQQYSTRYGGMVTGRLKAL